MKTVSVTNRHFIRYFCFLVLCGLVSQIELPKTGRLQAAERPNILFIFADDQNYKTLSCVPGAPEWVRTPHIDQLAEQGIRFERAYYGAWCMPSRASFLTGHLQHGVESMRMEGKYPRSVYDPAQCPFVPAVFREQGYQTAQIGKWHTGIDTGYGRDWDHQIVWNRPAFPDNAGNYFYDQILTVNGVEQRTPGYSTDNYTQWAVDYIQGQGRATEKPWYLWVCYGAVHGPTTPADRHEGNFAEQSVTIPADITGPFPHKPAFLQQTLSWMRGDDGEIYRRKRKLDASNFNNNTAGQSYADWVRQTNECMLAVDEGVGQLIAALKKSGQWENTIVVYTADQGFSLGQHGLNQKVAAYDAAIAAPLIITQPGKIVGNQVCQHPVNAPDLVRWFCEAATVKLPWKTHGRDIRPLLADPHIKDWRETMLMTHTGRAYGSDTAQLPTDDSMYIVGSVPWYALLRDGRYKYIRHLIPGEVEEIYDLEADPEELVNLAVVPDYEPLLKQLRQRTIQQLKETDAPFVDQLPATKYE